MGNRQGRNWGKPGGDVSKLRPERILLSSHRESPEERELRMNEHSFHYADFELTALRVRY